MVKCDGLSRKGVWFLKEKIVTVLGVVFWYDSGVCMCSGCSREHSQKDGSFEYSQHMLRGRLV